MKSIIILVLCTSSIYGQTVNGKSIDSLESQYIRISGNDRPFSNKIDVDIEFGQEDNQWTYGDTKLLDEKGKVLRFNSMIDALNFMYKYGYEFEAAYAFSNGQANFYHYLLKKRSKQ